jgi:hypothetical protein
MIVLRKLFVDLIGVGKKKLFWLSMILDTEFTDVDTMIVEGVAKEVSLLISEFGNDNPQEWTRLVAFLTYDIHEAFVRNFGLGITFMHYTTETYLRKYASHYSDMTANAALMEVCSKLSKYMMYLLVTHPSILPLSNCAEAALDLLQNKTAEFRGMDDRIARLDPSKGTIILEELARMWTRLLLYAAGKSRPAMHAAQLSGGGELITFAWLLMANCGLGESSFYRIQLTNTNTSTNTEHARYVELKEVYAFYVPPEYRSSPESPSQASQPPTPPEPPVCPPPPTHHIAPPLLHPEMFIKATPNPVSGGK